MANRTNSSEYFWSYEYYWDYIDPIPVDGSKLKVNKYSIVIAFWVGLAAFVTFLFLILLYMSRSGSTPVNSQSNSVSLDQIKRKFISEIRKITVCVPLLRSSQECCTYVRMHSLKGVLKKLGGIGEKTDLSSRNISYSERNQPKSIRFSRSSGSKRLLVNCLHLLEH
uniref:Melanocortin 2 receptor accessory protein n=1 Tax=Bubo bubo TaxID=30461 RepID=A0A8C0EGN9_BUBBB